LNDLVGIVKFLHGQNEKKKNHLQGAAATARWSLEMASNLFFLAHMFAIVAAASTLVAIV